MEALLKTYITKYPNDMDLGKNIRKDQVITEISDKYPNDIDLGSYIRKQFK